ncbi:GNAT family protein [Paenibacillus sp. GP183]|uniref:GNAT family N-acetyltransferase n=1 Tax=Paenibacillus sp. GP183 TaxID=1882751 RepID=UPI00089B85A6|nr:GNAT family protein [Paenibacillus sp. GP183]SEC68595.1 Protein N-acetyltransferase, RimJ/RimL family [Paenibacillus sp. GP183]
MNRPLPPVVLEGERVMLIPIETSHTHDLFEAGNDARIWKGIMEPIESLVSAQSMITQALEDKKQNGSLPFSVFDKESNKIVGSTRLFDFWPSHRQLEIGHTWYNPGVWRTRVNTECKYLLLMHSFEVLDMVRVQIKTDLRNTGSQAAITRLGAVKEGVLRQHKIMFDGYIRDTVMFSVIDREWPSVKARLEDFLQPKE